MNKVLRKIAKKMLLIPKVREGFEKVYEFYGISRSELESDFFKEDFEFYKLLRDGPRGLKGEFPERDAKALEKLVKMVIKEKIMIVEVGSWTGTSTAVLAKAIADYNGKVFAVDHWMGNEGVLHHESAKTIDIFSIFKRNMIMLGIWDIVHPLVMDSQIASQIFADGMLDLVFIDADHRYESVKKDILSWYPKLKDGGILCGHDCEGYYSEYPEELKKMIDEHLGDDYISGIHPGVVKALHDCFQGKYSIMPNSDVWHHIKKDTGSTC